MNKTLSYNCLLNFVVGPRGVGKTFSAKRRVIDNYIKKKGQQFVYLRRYDTELKQSKMNLFFDDVAPYYPEHDFLVQKGSFYIDSRTAGYYMPLSKAAQFKSVPFPNVSLIIFDEFIIDQGLIRYLPNEVRTFEEMYSTIARLRDVPVLFLSNAITFTNPYFLHFDLKLQKGQKVSRKGDILLEMVDSPKYTEAAQQTRFGKIVAETDYGRYAMANEFLLDSDTFIEKMSEAGNYLFTLKVGEKQFGVYGVTSTHNWYVTEDIDSTCKRIFAVSVDGHDSDSTLTKEVTARIWFEELKQKFYRAEIRFSSMNAKNILTEYLRRN